MKPLINIFRIHPEGHRTYGLDVMRSMAILIVVFGHAFMLFAPWYEELIPGLGVSLGRFMSSAIDGFDGVDLFFVLSGFLIGSILIRLFNSQDHLGAGSIFNFWKRRWMRTIPAYLCILLLNILVTVYLFQDQELTFAGVSKYFIFCQNLAYGGMGFFPESWSLSVEEWFYLSLPFILVTIYFLCRSFLSRKNIFLLVLFVYFAFVTGYRWYWGWGSTESWNDHFRTPVLMRLDTIMFGVFAAWIKFYYLDLWGRYRKFFFITGLLLLAINFYIAFILDWTYRVSFFNTFYFTFVGIGMMMFLPLADSIKTGKGFLKRIFTSTSIVSYSMYLVNYSLILKLLQHYYPIHSLVDAVICFVLFWVLVYLSSILSYKYIELPVLKYRDKISKKDAVV